MQSCYEHTSIRTYHPYSVFLSINCYFNMILSHVDSCMYMCAWLNMPTIPKALPLGMMVALWIGRAPEGKEEVQH